MRGMNRRSAIFGLTAPGTSRVQGRRGHARGRNSHVDRILKGEKPAKMAIEQPSNYQLVVSRNAARSLGIALSGDLLKRAQKVIG